MSRNISAGLKAPRACCADGKSPAELLRASDQTVESVALSVGYGAAIAFSKAFKRHFGESPGKFRTRRATD